MTYSTSTPPNLVTQGIAGTNTYNRWLLSGADTAATVQVTGYITNGGNLGMKVGDMVEYYDTNLAVTNSFNVITVSSTAPGAVDLQDATIIGSTTNSD